MNLRNLQPRRLQLEWQRFSTKWSKKLRGLDRQVLTLPPEGNELRGSVLVSYVLDGVRQALAGEIEHMFDIGMIGFGQVFVYVIDVSTV